MSANGHSNAESTRLGEESNMRRATSVAGTTEMAQYATAVAQHYNGQNGHGYIDSYEIGNEEFDNYLPPIRKIIDKHCPGMDLLPIAAPDLKAGYQAVKTQSPNAPVGMFAIWWPNLPHIQSSYAHPAKCNVSPQMQAQYMTYVLNSAANSHVVQHLFWYTLDPKQRDNSVIQPQSGALPSFYVMQQFARQKPTWR